MGEIMVEALGDIPRHLDMLDLVSPHRNMAGVEHQDIRRHQYRVAEQAHGDTEVGVLARPLVGLYRRLVGVGTIHQALGRVATEHPGQLGNLGNIRLAVKKSLVGIQPEGQPGRCDFLAGLTHHLRVLAFDQGMVVRQEKKGIDGRIPGRRDGRANRPDIVTEVGCTAGGDSREKALPGHAKSPAVKNGQ